MAIKRFIADADNTITNAYKPNLTTRGTGSNMGASDILEVFTIYGQESTASTEAARILINFPITEITTARTNEKIPASGSVEFYLRMHNADHSLTLPVDYNLIVSALTKSWDEGYGLDMDSYSDAGTGSGGFGSNWVYANGEPPDNGAWVTEGGDFSTASYYNKTASIGKNGTDDIEVLVTNIVEDWIGSAVGLSGTNGLIVKMSDEAVDKTRSFYTKRFFARGSEFFFKRPVLEARWDSSTKDDSGKFYASSSLVGESDNSNILYLYNYVNGTKKNIPSVGPGSSIYLSLYEDLAGNLVSATGSEHAVTGGWVSTGIYSASICIDTTASLLYGVWHNGLPPTAEDSAHIQFATCSVNIKKYESQCSNELPQHVTRITNLKSNYSDKENARFRLYIRKKDWSPTIYSVAKNDIENTIVENAFYKIMRLADNLDVIDYGTGSDLHTLLSYDKDGNYFDLDISMLEKDFAYGIKLLYKIHNDYVEQRELFKFRVT